MRSYPAELEAARAGLRQRLDELEAATPAELAGALRRVDVALERVAYLHSVPARN